jgi:hypothetical protein
MGGSFNLRFQAIKMLELNRVIKKQDLLSRRRKAPLFLPELFCWILPIRHVWLKNFKVFNERRWIPACAGMTVEI